MSRVIQGQNTELNLYTLAGFSSDLLAIWGDVRFLWIPDVEDSGTTTVELSKNQDTITWQADLSNFTRVGLGSGEARTFNGTAQQGDTPDSADHNFGDGVNDQPLTVVAVVKMNGSGGLANSTILSKADSGTGADDEYMFETDGNSDLRFVMFDDSANASIEANTSTGAEMTADVDALCIGTYDGSRAEAGINLYIYNATTKGLVTVARTETNTYTAMEDQAAVLKIGYNIESGTTETNFFDGNMSLLGLIGAELTEQQCWATMRAVEEYFDLTLV